MFPYWQEKRFKFHIAALIFLIYTATMQISFITEYQDTNACPIWIPAAVNVLAFFYRPKEAFISIWLGGFLNNLYGFIDGSLEFALKVSFEISIGHIIAGCIGGYILRRDVDVFETKPIFFNFLTGMCWISLLSAVIGVSAINFAGGLEGIDKFYVFCTWFIGDLSGILLIVPVWSIWRVTGYDRKLILQTSFGLFVFLSTERLLYDLTSHLPITVFFTTIFILTTYYIFYNRQQVAMTLITCLSLIILYRIILEGRYLFFNSTAPNMDLLTVQAILTSIMIFHYPLVLISRNGLKQFLADPFFFISSVLISSLILFLFLTIIIIP